MDTRKLCSLLKVSLQDLDNMIAAGMTTGRSREEVRQSLEGTALLVEATEEQKEKAQATKRLEELLVRQEENAILEQHRELIERRVKKIEATCPKCGSACVTTFGYLGGARNKIDFLTCGNHRCSNHTLGGKDHDCDSEPGLNEDRCKRKMFYDP